MKKWTFFLLLPLLLAGCRAEQTFETIRDEWAIPAMAQERQISVSLPEEVSISAMQNDIGKLYLCDGYEIAIETMESGDMNRTIRTLTGHDKKDLTIMTTEENGIQRYEFVWASEEEQGDRLGQGVILDDGNYHYTMTVLRDAEPAQPSQIIWSQVFRSFQVS